ncbi:hypothetical protein EBT16_06350 [bacterium]|nr:hypothetical protein [bacterium]
MKPLMGILISILIITGCATAETKTEQNKAQNTLCEKSGCNGEICAEKGKKMISPCVVLPQHQCLKMSKCEVQPNGKCGWTPNPEYQACLKKFLPK